MNKLTQKFLESCKYENGFIIRGENMSRIETFVDAAFAFAFTMIVISLDEIPDSPGALFETSRDLPAFIASGLQIGFIWYGHSRWSRRFGLQDGMTIFLSMCLVMLTLVFIYPIKLVFMGLFKWLSGGVLSPTFGLTSISELANLFAYFAIGFLILSVIFYLFFKNTLKHQTELGLTDFEKYYCKTEAVSWIITGTTAVIALILAITLTGGWVVSSGFFYSTLYVTKSLWYRSREKSQPAI